MTAEEVKRYGEKYMTPINESYKETFRDIADWLNYGTQRRQQEYNSAEAAMDRAFQAEQAQIQRDYNRELASTAHQIEVADLQAAGLNPVLSASLGGAAVPNAGIASGASASTSGAVNSASALTSIISAMTGLQHAKNQAKMLDPNSAKTVKVYKFIKHIK